MSRCFNGKTIQKIPIGISSCLLGEKVRYDGGHKRNATIIDTLGEYFEFHPFCPEVGIGLGVPRPKIQLVKIAGQIRCVGVEETAMDFTESLRNYANEQNQHHAKLYGYIFKANSPSCGMERVKVYQNKQIDREGAGIYAQQMMKNNPLLPVEDEERLGNLELRENFIQQVYVFYQKKNLTGLKDLSGLNA